MDFIREGKVGVCIVNSTFSLIPNRYILVG